MAAFSYKFCQSVVQFVSIPCHSALVQQSSFFKRLLLEPKDYTIKLPLFYSYKFLSERNPFISDKPSIVSLPKIKYVKGNYTNINKLFTDEFTKGILGRYRGSVSGIVEFTVNNHKYYISRGFIADDDYVYMYIENTYKRVIDNLKDTYVIQEEHIYVNSCIYSAKNDMTKFITSRLLPCINTLRVDNPHYKVRSGTIHIEMIDLYSSEEKEGPCCDNLKISYICNSKINKILKGVEAPNIKTFNNEEILSNIIKYLEK